jgi:HlyD family secretion protein
LDSYAAETMDIQRPAADRARIKRKRAASWAAGIAAVLLLTLGLSQLKPAAPSVERSTVWTDTVRRGLMVRQVRGLGTLVPEEIRWIPALTEARVERIVVHPGTTVAPDTVILELSNPELELLAREAESELLAAEAEYTELRIRLESERLDQEATAARVQAEYQQAKMRRAADEQLAEEGLIADINLQISRVAAEELAKRSDLEQKRLAIAGESVEAQLAAHRARVEQSRALSRLRRSQVEALHLRAGIAGVLQQVPVEVGERVTPGTNLARVARPDRLKAEVRIAETQAKDVQLGQSVSIDTRNGVIEGKVSRIDPAVQNGTVTVDVVLEGPLPKGARPDLTVDGTIELERLEDVLYVGRPAQGQGDSVVGLFRLVPDTDEAVRTRVALGRASVSTIEVLEGLAEGDEVILSDTSTWDAHDRIRLD